MSNDGNIHTILDRFKGPHLRNEERWQAEGGKTPYRAVELAPEKSATLRVHYNTGNIHLLRYMYMSAISFVANRDEMAIHYPAGQVAIYGKNLRPLIDAFEGEQVKRVVPYNPSIHIQPAEGEPLIEDIVFWPKDAPKAD